LALSASLFLDDLKHSNAKFKGKTLSCIQINTDLTESGQQKFQQCGGKHHHPFTNSKNTKLNINQLLTNILIKAFQQKLWIK